MQFHLLFYCLVKVRSSVSPLGPPFSILPRTTSKRLRRSIHLVCICQGQVSSLVSQILQFICLIMWSPPCCVTLYALTLVPIPIQSYILNHSICWGKENQECPAPTDLSPALLLAATSAASLAQGGSPPIMFYFLEWSNLPSFPCSAAITAVQLWAGS